MLYGDKVRSYERDVVNLLEHADDTGVIDARDHDRQEIGEQGRLLLQVEGEGLVVAIDLTLVSS